MHFVPFEDRPSEWMQRAADPFRFERRIQMMEDMLSNVFLKKNFFFGMITLKKYRKLEEKCSFLQLFSFSAAGKKVLRREISSGKF